MYAFWRWLEMIGVIRCSYSHVGFRSQQVKYYIANSEGKDYFEINEFTGEIFTKIVFDREKQAAYALGKAIHLVYLSISNV